ncbi:unnamed protein product [Rhizoctonia solani]|uniref:Uncharacterized protein n=1 Tax=Rhizoctonia solani TaxID=456999 RepID=A0A8H3GYF9_9AGAM|nr:unnamed protein product [Rhizoctonia solani]CAE7206003.1 unnamed protein product [Rhizoctonia solani]
MNNDAEIPKDFDLELLEAQGGNIAPNHFNELLYQLQKSGSLDYATTQALGAPLGELDIVYVVLRKGYIYDVGTDKIPRYTCVMKNEADHWLAGFGSLRVSQSGSGGGSTAEILVSLLPRAHKSGCGRFLVQKLLQYAFDTLRGSIHRVTAPVVCPVQPYHTATQRKQILFKTKQLCWMFEKLGFKFEGVTRGAVESFAGAEGGKPVWHDVHRMSILNTDHLDPLSHAYAFNDAPERVAKADPWQSMLQRQEEEKRDLESWTEKPVGLARADDACDGEDQSDGESDDDTVLGDGDSDWEMPDDYDN